MGVGPTQTPNPEVNPLPSRSFRAFMFPPTPPPPALLLLFMSLFMLGTRRELAAGNTEEPFRLSDPRSSKAPRPLSEVELLTSRTSH